MYQIVSMFQSIDSENTYILPGWFTRYDRSQDISLSTYNFNLRLPVDQFSDTVAISQDFRVKHKDQ